MRVKFKLLSWMRPDATLADGSPNLDPATGEPYRHELTFGPSASNVPGASALGTFRASLAPDEVPADLEVGQEVTFERVSE